MPTVNFQELEQDPVFQSLSDENKVFILQKLREQINQPGRLAESQQQVQQMQAQGMAQLEAATPPVSVPVAAVRDLSTVQSIGQRAIDNLNRAPAQPETNFFGDLAGGFQYGASAGHVDQPRGHGIGNMLGESVGPIVPVVLGGLAGAGVGSVVPGLGTGVGGLVGAGTAGAATFAELERQRQIKAGEEGDWRKIATSGAFGGVSSVVPVLRGGRIFTQILKNAALGAGLGAGETAVKQGLDQRFDLGEIVTSAGGGALFSGTLGAVFPKIKTTHPEIAAKIEAGQALTEPEAVLVGKLLTPDESKALQEAWQQRSVGEPQKVITSPFDEAQAVQDIGIRKPVQETVGDAGVTITREGAPRDIGQIETASAPMGERVEPIQTLNSDTIIDPATGKPFQAPERKLRTGVDLAMERTSQMLDEEPALPRDLGDVKPRPLTPETLDAPSRPVDLMDAQGRPLRQSETPPVRDLLDAQGRPVNADISPAQVLDLSGRPLDLARVANEPTPANQELQGRIQTTAQGAEVFTPENIEPQRTQEQLAQLQAEVQGRQGQLISIAEAQRFMKEAGRPGMDHLMNFLEAGKNNQTFDIKYTPLGEGRSTTQTRNISPFALEKRTIKPDTELKNLRKQFGSDEAVRDHLIQFARQRGGNIGAGDITTKPASMKAAIERLGLNQHVYMHSHNFGETTVGTGKSERGYRLDTITESSLTGQAQALPEGTQYTNQIAPAFNILQEIAKSPNAPKPMNRVVMQITSGKVSRQTLNDVRSMFREAPEQMARLCDLLGIK